MKISTAIAALGVSCGLAACAHNDQFKKSSPQRQAATNMQLSIEYMKLGKMAASKEFIDRAIVEDPQNASIQMTQGVVYERLKDPVQAEKGYSTAYRLGKKDPNIVGAYAGFLCRTGKAPAGEKLFVEVAGNPVYSTPEIGWLNAGVCVRGTGDVVDAERYFDRALAIHPNLPEALLQVGNIQFDRGDAREAVETVQRYLAVNPATPEVLWLGVRAERKLGDPVAAAAYARRVQAEFPTSDQAQMMRSGVDR